MKKGLLAAYRYRIYFFFTAIAALVGKEIVQRLSSEFASVETILSMTMLVLIAFSLLLTVAGPRLLEPVESRAVVPPVAGEWSALNSPASKIPSHGIRLYGQAYAIDLVAESPGLRPAFGSGPAMRKPEEYPAFGAPVYAMASGTVSEVVAQRRDHRARSRWGSVLYMLVEGMVRELAGMSFLLGNYITINHGDGTFSLIAHLKRDSVKVKVGSAVEAGDVIAECGNSGNSSEPHVHAQLMDRPKPRTAQGVPMTFIGIADDAGSAIDLPATGQTMVTASSLSAPEG